MNSEQCCNHNCNQGRDCPLRKKKLNTSPPHIVDSGASVMAKEPTDDEIWKLWVKHLNDDIIVFAREVLKKVQK